MKISARWWIPSAGAEKGGEDLHVPGTPPDAGRWCGIPETLVTSEARALAFADQLLARWGVLFRDLLARESLAPPWRDLLPVLRRKEAQGEIRGGRFVSGFSGEQFARPEALDLLRAIRRSAQDPEEQLDVANSDPLNLAGIILPGPRVSTLSRVAPGRHSQCYHGSVR